MVQHPELATLELPKGWETLASPGITLLQQLLATAEQQPDISPAALVERWEDPTTRSQLGKLAVLELGVVDDAADQFIGTLRGLAQEQLRNERESLLEKSRVSGLNDNEKQRLRELFTSTTANR